MEAGGNAMTVRVDHILVIGGRGGREIWNYLLQVLVVVRKPP